MKDDQHEGWQAHPLAFPFVMTVSFAMVLINIVLAVPVMVWAMLKRDR